ncbi:MAG: RNA 2',3'-cyclic phosphodiesterase [Spirochaeta sp.]
MKNHKTDPGTEQRRLFIAFPLPEDVQEHLKQIQKHLETLLPQPVFRWVNPANTHVTLHFLGDIPEKEIPSVTAAIQEAAGDGVIRCRLGGIGFFPAGRRPRVVWLGVNEMQSRRVPDLNAQGRKIYHVLEQSLTAAGIESDSPRYTPHITLGYRLRKADPGDVDNAAAAWRREFDPKGLIFTLRSIVLFESTVENGKRKYLPLHTEPLH